jgi:branched-chain amino acid transport system permease protein
VGAYSYAMLSTRYGLGFWSVLPLAGMMAATFGLLLGFPVLRLRGDYLAIVTMGFGEIIRLVLLNWVDLSNGPAGIGGIPGPTLFGAVFAETAPAGKQTFAEMVGIPFSSNQRLIYLYYIILLLALVTNFFTQRVRRLPVGRAWEALREDETACKALGINPTNTKLTCLRGWRDVRRASPAPSFARSSASSAPRASASSNRRSSSPSSCWAAWAARSAWCWRRCC